jgi:hypothetical protein
MWSRSECPLLASKDEDAYVRLNSGKYEKHAQRLQSTAARRVMQRDEDVFVLVSSRVCICPWLLCVAWAENGFMDVVTRVHGHTMFAKRLPVRADSLLLHGAIFHSHCCCFTGIWNRVATVWAVWLEMDWQRNNHWRDRAQFDSGIRSRPILAKKTRMNPRRLKRK